MAYTARILLVRNDGAPHGLCAINNLFNKSFDSSTSLLQVSATTEEAINERVDDMLLMEGIDRKNSVPMGFSKDTVTHEHGNDEQTNMFYTVTIVKN